MTNFSFSTIVTDNYFSTIKYVKSFIMKSFENVRLNRK